MAHNAVVIQYLHAAIYLFCFQERFLFMSHLEMRKRQIRGSDPWQEVFRKMNALGFSAKGNS
jgi:hypothetical protein